MMNTLVISSFAKDRLIWEDRIETRTGGPALFITKVLLENNIPFEIASGRTARVDIDMMGGLEIGKVIEVHPPIVKTEGAPDLVMISTISDEHPLVAMGDFCCVDIQGYIRSNAVGKRPQFDWAELERFDIIKAAEKEAMLIPKHLTRRLKLLLVTKGDDGFDVSEYGKIRSFRAKRVDPPDTIGAGDTLFCAFCLKYYQTRDIKQSSEFATETVTRFLRQKTRK